MKTVCQASLRGDVQVVANGEVGIAKDGEAVAIGIDVVFAIVVIGEAVGGVGRSRA